MSLHYLLDGYNIIKQRAALKDKSLKDGREGLVRLIEVSRPQGSLKNAVTVVFDGQRGIAYDSSTDIVKVLFSKDETADEKIKRMVSRFTHKKSVVVVTDDRPLKFSVRSMGAQVMAVKNFLKKSEIQNKETDCGQKRISKTEEYNITKELEKIWLKKS